MSDRIDEIREMTEWQPIETWRGQAAILCTLGRNVFMYAEGFMPAVTSRYGGPTTIATKESLTHWQPLPKPPMEAAKTEEER